MKEDPDPVLEGEQWRKGHPIKNITRRILTNNSEAKSKVKETSSFYGRFIKIDSNLFGSVTLGEEGSESRARRNTAKSSFAEFLGAGSNIPLKNGMTTVATATMTAAAVTVAVAALAYTAALREPHHSADRNSNRNGG